MPHEDRDPEDDSRTKCRTLCRFLSPVTFTFDLRPLTFTFELGREFCPMHVTVKVRRPSFNRSEVIVLTNKQTNKQTPLKTYTSLRYATAVGNY